MGNSSVTAALERFIAERGDGLLRAAVMLTSDHHHAEDLLQTALAKSWDKFSTLGSENQFEAYLRTTMFRTYVSWWRRSSWRSEIPTDRIPEPDARPNSAQPGNPDLVRALQDLPRMQRAVMVLRFLEDRPIADVAQLLAISPGTVKKYTHRGCKALRGSVHLAEEEPSHG